MDDSRRSTNKKNQGSGLGVGIFIAVYLLYTVTRSAFRGAGFATFGRVFFIIIIAVLAGLAVGIILKVKGAGKSTQKSTPPFSGRPVNRETMAPIQRELLERIRHPAAKEEQLLDTVPKAAPARGYNDNIREENAVRDRQRRLRQLDDFYKNGIINKEEYRVLRNRYGREDK